MNLTVEDLLCGSLQYFRFFSKELRVKSKWGMILGTAVCIATAQSALVWAQGMEVTSAKVYLKENPPKFDKVVELLQTALKKDPQYNEAHFFLGMVHSYRGNFAEFFKEWDQVSYDKLGKTEKMQYTRQLSDMVRTRLVEATKQYEAKKFDGAVTEFKASIGATNLLQTALKGSNKKEDIENIQKMETSKQQSYLFLGYAANSAGMLDEAAVALEKSTEVDPKNEQAWNGLVNTYARQKNQDKLIMACNKVIELNKQPDLDTYLLLRNTYFDKGDTNKVIETYERAVGAFPAEYTLYRDLSGFYAERRMFENAVVLLEKANVNIPNNVDILGYLGAVYYNIGFAKEKVGDQMAAKDAFTRAISPLEQLIKLEPLSIDGHDTLGKVYQGLGKVETDKKQQQAMSAKGDAMMEKRRTLINSGEGK